jgi:hypothetical protein
MIIKYFNIIDENIKSTVLQYLTYKNINSIKTLDKNFNNFLKKYQNYKLSYEINNTFLTDNIKKTIYKKLYSQSYILENIFDKPPNIFINICKFDDNLIEVYLINEDLEYEIIFTKSIDFSNRFEYFYYGGEIYIFFEEKCIKYNLLKKKWTNHQIKLSTFDKKYIYRKYEILNNKIYIVQSFWNINNNLISYHLTILDEYYIGKDLDISTKNIVPRRFHAITQFEEQLWVAGGIDDNNYISSVEVFDNEKNIWNLCNNMNKARINFKLIVHDNNLYAVGGDINCITTIEKFDNINRKWYLITQLNVDTTMSYISLINNYIIVCNKKSFSNPDYINNLLEEYQQEKQYKNKTYIFDIIKCTWINSEDLKKFLHFL